MREKTGMKSHQPKAETAGQRRVGLQVAPVLFPMLVGNDATGALDRLHGGVILPNSRDHPGDNLNSSEGTKCADIAPDLRLRSNWIQRELQTWNFQFLNPIDELLWVLRLQRPTANGEPVPNGKGIRNPGIETPVLHMLNEFDESTGLATQAIAH